MSATLECPRCGAVTKDSGGGSFGDVLDDAQVEALICGGDYNRVREGGGRRWHECPCGQGVWIERSDLVESDRGGGRWFIAGDATTQLQALQDVAQEMAFILERFDWSELRAFCEAHPKKYGWTRRKASELRDALRAINEAGAK